MNGTQNQKEELAGSYLWSILYIIFNPIPGPIDDAAVAAIGGYHALKRL